MNDVYIIESWFDERLNKCNVHARPDRQPKLQVQQHDSTQLKWTRSVVKQQSAHISAEWLLLLGCLLRRGSGSSSDLGISWALLHADVG